MIGIEDNKGQHRELHTSLAKKATKVFASKGKSSYQLKENKTSNLVNCKFFTTNIFEVKGLQKRDYKDLDSFVIFICVEGKAEITINNYKEFMAMGETVLIPANSEHVMLNSHGAKLLEVFINFKDSNFKKIAS